MQIECVHNLETLPYRKRHTNSKISISENWHGFTRKGSQTNNDSKCWHNTHSERATAAVLLKVFTCKKSVSPRKSNWDILVKTV